MNHRTITIVNNPLKNGLSYQRPFTCQVFESGNKRTYILDDTKREVVRKHFLLRPGCKIIDNGITHVIKDIWYPPAPKHPHLIVFPDASE